MVLDATVIIVILAIVIVFPYLGGDPLLGVRWPSERAFSPRKRGFFLHILGPGDLGVLINKIFFKPIRC